MLGGLGSPTPPDRRRRPVRPARLQAAIGRARACGPGSRRAAGGRWPRPARRCRLRRRRDRRLRGGHLGSLVFLSARLFAHVDGRPADADVAAKLRMLARAGPGRTGGAGGARSRVAVVVWRALPRAAVTPRAAALAGRRHVPGDAARAELRPADDDRRGGLVSDRPRSRAQSCALSEIVVLSLALTLPLGELAFGNHAPPISLGAEILLFDLVARPNYAARGTTRPWRPSRLRGRSPPASGRKAASRLRPRGTTRRAPDGRPRETVGSVFRPLYQSDS